MAVNTNFYAVSNELFSRASGGGISATQVVDYATFIDAGKALSSLTYTDLQNTLVPAIMNKIQKTINDNPEYVGQLLDMYQGKLNYGILEMIINDFYAATPSVWDGATLESGQTYTDQFKVENLPNQTARYYTESDSWGFDITIRDTDLQGIVDDPAKLDGFIRLTFISVINSIAAHREEHRFALLADVIKNAAAETAEDDDENTPAQNYNLLAIYNELKGTELTAASCLLSNDFVSWSVGVIRDVSLLMEKPSKVFNKNKTHVTFSCRDYRKLVVNAIYDKAIRRSLIDAYNKEYGMITDDYEVVPFWQTMTDRLRVTTNSTPAQGQSVVTTYSPYVLAVVYDKRAVGTMVQLDDVTVDRNNKRRYSNYHYQMNDMYFRNPDANAVIFTIGSAS